MKASVREAAGELPLTHGYKWFAFRQVGSGSTRLRFADSEHFRPASRTGTLHRWLAIHESDLLGIFDVDPLLALHAVRLSHGTLLCIRISRALGSQYPVCIIAAMSTRSQ